METFLEILREVLKGMMREVGAYFFRKKVHSAVEAWVVSNSYITKTAKELARKSNIVLVDRDELIESILSSNPKVKRESSSTAISGSPVAVCSKCGISMVLRIGKRGIFLGCSNFPNCRYTKDAG